MTSISEKKTKIEGLTKRLMALKDLVNRNAKYQTKKHLMFPFVIVAQDVMNKSELEVFTNEKKDRVVFTSQQKIVLLGDCDVCSFLDISSVKV